METQLDSPRRLPGGAAGRGRRGRPRAGPDVLAAGPRALPAPPPGGDRPLHDDDPDRHADRRPDRSSGDAWKRRPCERINQPPSLARAARLRRDLGSNMFARLMKGLQTSLFIGFAAVIIIACIGVPSASIAGYFGGLGRQRC